MRTFSAIFLMMVVLVLSLSCQRELAFDESVGVLKKDLSGNCLPVNVSGTFTADTTLTAENYVDVQVNVFIPGSFDIRTDTVNGYSFGARGNLKMGEAPVRLYGNGKPLAGGINTFVAKYGTSTCVFKVNVAKPRPAVFTLGGAPNVCSGAVVGGTYRAGNSLTPTNTLTVQVIVDTPGTYTLNAATTNGFLFTKSGVFTTTGLQNVTLTGLGIPISPGPTAVTVSAPNTSCTFSINVLPPVNGNAIFSFDGTPGRCIDFTVNGIYAQGTGTSASNTIKLYVSVSAAGSYNINTNSADGISFSKSGFFFNTGRDSVELTATGTPVNQGTWDFIPNTGSNGCTFSVTVLPPFPPAVFTLSGAPNNCSPVTVNGFYIVSKPLDAANTIIIQVNVSTAGTYSFSTNTVNGISFSASGIFPTTGLQNVILRGNGTPLSTGTTILTPNFGGSACTFSVLVI